MLGEGRKICFGDLKHECMSAKWPSQMEPMISPGFAIVFGSPRLFLVCCLRSCVSVYKCKSRSVLCLTHKMNILTKHYENVNTQSFSEIRACGIERFLGCGRYILALAYYISIKV